MAALAAAAALVIWQLFVPPRLGLADNADFFKLLWPNGLRYFADGVDYRFDYIHLKFRFAEWAWSGYLSSESLIIRTARLVGRLTTRDGYFDLRVLGALHAALFILALALIASGLRALPAAPRRVALALLVFAFTDVVYIAPFNSFYSQTASLLALLAAAGCVAHLVWRDERRRAACYGLALAAALFITSKPQEAPLAAPLAALVFLAARTARLRHAALQGLALALCLLALGAWYYRRTPAYLREAAAYNIVFAELLAHSPAPEQDLAALGADPSLARLRGTNAFQPEAPIREPDFRDAFAARVDHLTIVRFYLTHPRRLLDLLERRAAQAFDPPSSLGNYEQRAGFPPRHVNTSFRRWTDLRSSVMPRGLAGLGALFAVNLLLALALRRWGGFSARARFGLDAFVALNICALGAFLITALGDCIDHERHMYAFQAMSDLALITAVAGLVEAARRFIRRQLVTT